MSRSIWPEAASPATVFTSIGKKVMTTTTAAFDGQSKPNHITMIGAMPTIGSAETKLPSGSRPRLRKGERSMAMATAKPSPQPSAYPLSTDLRKVWAKSAASTGRLATIRAQMAEGGGRMISGTPPPRVPASQSSSTEAPNIMGTSRAVTSRRAVPSRAACDSRSANSQASSQVTTRVSQKPGPARSMRARPKSTTAPPTTASAPAWAAGKRLRKASTETKVTARNTAAGGKPQLVTGASPSVPKGSASPRRLRPAATMVM
jgi:hypothetical protein